MGRSVGRSVYASGPETVQPVTKDISDYQVVDAERISYPDSFREFDHAVLSFLYRFCR